MRLVYLRSAVLGVVLGSAPAFGSFAQKPPEPPPAVDPYTESEAEKLAALGYERYAPFPFGDGHGTKAIEDALGLPVLWVETAHFKLGSTLPAYKVGRDAKERKRIRGELERLSERLDTVSARAKKLDPWLRLHLYAQRLEELYAEIETLLGAVDDGDGPFFGMRGKFCVLLFGKASGLGRYSGHFLKREGEGALRSHYAEVDSMVYAAHMEALEGDFATDVAFHTIVTFGVVQNLLDGYRGYRHVLPLWWQEGIAHAFARRIEPRCNVNGADASRREANAKGWDWAPRVRARVRTGATCSWETLFGWATPDEVSLPDRMVMWSRGEYLVRERPDVVRQFQRALNEPPLGSWQRPSNDVFVPGQKKALEAATGQSLEELDAAWAAFVEREYPKK